MNLIGVNSLVMNLKVMDSLLKKLNFVNFFWPPK
jgi:hypothetical protein